MADGATIRSDTLTVAIAATGAELQTVTDADGAEWLWDGDPQWWAGRAPILFPTVGISRDGVARFGERTCAMPKHGIARHRPFMLVASDAASATFRLEDDAETREAYPFAFALDVTHSLAGRTLTSTAVVRNRGDEPMPAGFGFHPALRWPLPGTGAGSRNRHFVRFDAEEPEALRQITTEGLIAAGGRPTPVHDNELQVRDHLFTADALVWDRVRSRGLYFGVEGHPGVRVDFPDMPMLGIWTKPGAGYLCIEPWHSRADDVGYAGQFADRPGIVTVPPGGEAGFAMALTFGVSVD